MKLLSLSCLHILARSGRLVRELSMDETLTYLLLQGVSINDKS